MPKIETALVPTIQNQSDQPIHYTFMILFMSLVFPSTAHTSTNATQEELAALLRTQPTKTFQNAQKKVKQILHTMPRSQPRARSMSRGGGPKSRRTTRRRSTTPLQIKIDTTVAKHPFILNMIVCFLFLVRNNHNFMHLICLLYGDLSKHDDLENSLKELFYDNDNSSGEIRGGMQYRFNNPIIAFAVLVLFAIVVIYDLYVFQLKIQNTINTIQGTRLYKRVLDLKSYYTLESSKTIQCIYNRYSSIKQMPVSQLGERVLSTIESDSLYYLLGIKDCILKPSFMLELTDALKTEHLWKKYEEAAEPTMMSTTEKSSSAMTASKKSATIVNNDLMLSALDDIKVDFMVEREPTRSMSIARSAQSIESITKKPRTSMVGFSIIPRLKSLHPEVWEKLPPATMDKIVDIEAEFKTVALKREDFQPTIITEKIKELKAVVDKYDTPEKIARKILSDEEYVQWSTYTGETAQKTVNVLKSTASITYLMAQSVYQMVSYAIATQTFVSTIDKIIYDLTTAINDLQLQMNLLHANVAGEVRQLTTDLPYFLKESEGFYQYFYFKSVQYVGLLSFVSSAAAFLLLKSKGDLTTVPTRESRRLLTL